MKCQRDVLRQIIENGVWIKPGPAFCAATYRGYFTCPRHTNQDYWIHIRYPEDIQREAIEAQAKHELIPDFICRDCNRRKGR